MNMFTLHLQSATQGETIEGVTTFVAQDASGSFGLLVGHERLMTSLPFGLAKFQTGDGRWEYVAVPRALLYFVDNELFVTCRRYLRDADLDRVSQSLEHQLRMEEATLHGIKDSLKQLEEEMFRRLWQTGRRRAWP